MDNRSIFIVFISLLVAGFFTVVLYNILLEIQNFPSVEKEETIGGSWKDPIPILVFVCNRVEAVREHLRKLIRYRSDPKLFPIVVTQDCDDERVKKAVLEFGDQVSYIKHVSGAHANITVPKELSHFVTYYRIARHYKLALNHVFNTLKYSSVVITEDDLDISFDFFSYFSSTRRLLEEDPTLWCVSAWNDNGKPETIDVNATTLLYRSDFFSGLGWMMTSKLWEEIESIWPSGFWDDWMREPSIRKNRQCIRPEIGRTSMTKFGQKGASKGLFFKKHLAKIISNTSPVHFEKQDLDYLLLQNYNTTFMKQVYESSKLMSIEDITKHILNADDTSEKFIRIEYKNNKDYVKKAHTLGVMVDFKAGVPRTAYEGVVSCFVKGHRIYLVPDRNYVREYNPKWTAPDNI